MVGFTVQFPANKKDNCVAGICLQGGSRPTKYLVKLKAVLLLVKMILVFLCNRLVSVLHYSSTNVVSDLVLCCS